jgi:S-adenosylmethionine hydrolase
MGKSVITLLTDFGTKDYYVASMKGTILNINPQCTLVDITHHVSPHDITEGAFILANAYSSFPKGTIHLSVVDPGVGSPRAPILLVTTNYFFIGPDNGLFTLALKKEKVRKGIVLTNPKYFLSHRSTTFHGRDLFAPVAAHLSMGIKPEVFGPILDSWVEIEFEKPGIRGRALIGKILHIDAFGNLISNIDDQKLFNHVRGDSFVIRVGKKSVQGLKKAYWEGKKNEPIALIGSGGFLEVSIREGNAQKVLKVGKGDKIEISRQ